MERITRREALGRGAALAGVAATGGLLAACGSSTSDDAPRVVIVGAGLAGLTCAHRLRQAGVSTTVYEAQQRVGGRCWSTRTVVPGLVGEHGGELIDTGHHRIRALAAELGLTMEDRLAAEQASGAHDEVVIGGRPRSRAAVTAGYAEMVQRLEADAARTGTPRAGHASASARALDERSARDWLDLNIPGGSGSLLGRAVSAELTGSFGLDPQDLSAFALVQNYTGADNGPPERFHVRGGNDQIPRKLAAGLPEASLRVGSAMQGLRRRSGGGYQLVLDRYRNPVNADIIVLTQPLPALRSADLSAAGLPAAQRRMIAELGMGTNAKLLLGLRRRPPAYGGWSGDLLADDPMLQTWDSSLAQQPSVRQGLLSLFTGGADARALAVSAAHAPAPEAVVRRALRTLEPIAPGISHAVTGEAWLDAWQHDHWTGGSYAAFRPGQVTRFWGLLQRPVAGIVFAGEHTSTRAQGYLEGAVESGERAARQVRARLRAGASG